MKNINNAWKIYSILFTALCVTYALSDQPGTETKTNQPRAILNAKELGIDDLDIDLESIDVDDLDIEEVAVEEPEAVEEVVEAAEEAVEEAPVDEVEEIAEVVEEPEAVEEVAEAVEEAVEEAPVDEVEEIVEVVEEPEAVEEVAEAVEEAVEEAPVDEVEEIVEVVEEPEAVEEVAEAVEEAVEEAPVDEVEEIVEVVEEPEAVEEVAEAVEEAVEEAPVDEVEEIVEVVEEPEAVEEVAEAVEEAVEEQDTSSIGAEIDSILNDVEEETTEEVAEEPEVVEEVTEVVEEPEAVEEVAEVVEEPEAVEEVAEAAEEAVEEAPVEKTEETVEVADDPVTKAVDEAMTIEIARREAYDKHAIQCITNGEDALVRGKYDTAIAQFKEASDFVRESRRDLRVKVDEGLAEAWFRKAVMYRQVNNLADAENAVRQARQLAHPAAEELMVQIKKDQENPPPPPPVKRIKRWNEKEYKNNIADIRARMSRAREYYSTGEYELCRREVEFCLRDYPWCKDAVGLLRKVNTRLGEFYDDERITTRTEMISDVTKAWTPGNYGLDYEDTGYASRSTSTSEESVITLGTTEEMKILEKMKRITIPEIDFRQANITDVITFLSEASREYDEDKDIPEERRGINIILNLGASAEPAAAAPAADDFGGGWDSALSDASSTSSTGGVPPITTSARFVTLLDAMNMIMDVAKLKYRVKGNMVLVMPANAPDGELIHRMYPVLPSFVEKAKSLREEEKASGDFGDAIAIESTKFEDTQDWKKFFGELGVQWPEGSTVKYVGSIGKLIVKNTSEQLASLEKVLAELNVTPHQVEIEVRFVEVMQTDLDSLGLEWNMNSNWGIAEHRQDSHLDYSDRRRIEMSSGSITSGFNFLSNNSEMKINDGMPIADGIATFSSILTNPELSVVLHMLSTKKNSDLLSAPKVVTASGREATIKVVTEFIYPTSYDVEMLESDSGDDDGGTTYAGAVVEPSDFMTREVGVILSVTPEVAPDGSRIYLRLAPSVISEPTWKNYGSEYPMSVPVENTVIESVLGGLIPYTRYETKMAKLPMEQPFFPVRSVVTELDVYNGSTVVMGGMITEERIACEDKIPVLGDIPLIGHLFRNKYEQSEKRNLLLFVTARLVDAGGREVKNPSVDGIFAE